jgi:hypothetical protein
MKVKNIEWINFKNTIIEYIKIFEEENISYEYPDEHDDNFTILVHNCEVFPVFQKKENLLKVEYDFSLCQTKIRTLSFSKYFESVRIEITLK